MNASITIPELRQTEDGWIWVCLIPGCDLHGDEPWPDPLDAEDEHAAHLHDCHPALAEDQPGPSTPETETSCPQPEDRHRHHRYVAARRP